MHTKPRRSLFANSAKPKPSKPSMPLMALKACQYWVESLIHESVVMVSMTTKLESGNQPQCGCLCCNRSFANGSKLSSHFWSSGWPSLVGSFVAKFLWKFSSDSTSPNTPNMKSNNGNKYCPASNWLILHREKEPLPKPEVLVPKLIIFCPQL